MCETKVARRYLIPPHFVLRRGESFLLEVPSGRTTADPWRAMNTCDRAFAERLRDQLNESADDGAWAVELLEGTGIPFEQGRAA